MGFWIIYIHVHGFALFLCLIKDMINIRCVINLTGANNFFLLLYKKLLCTTVIVFHYYFFKKIYRIFMFLSEIYRSAISDVLNSFSLYDNDKNNFVYTYM